MARELKGFGNLGVVTVTGFVLFSQPLLCRGFAALVRYLQGQEGSPHYGCQDKISLINSDNEQRKI